ncbi:lysine exporter protein LysE/YggA [Nitratireductor indicus C115]|uniref:Lysine exporter protein LysE/YggA n=1 Tax=Nitratireductor indicus C115 TaxID=1231190 RepID=K2N8W7_9HYPH|nr:LysE/ArgO family amino acid transporter [Nitratireductor indicus]EKF43943.1 lysine exporter protein LysE/YggA [Nitratireductor indicus C115]SFQ13700.1 L-lysine exporter family protein LysE/ArgO [Nitratireductor indicus]
MEPSVFLTGMMIGLSLIVAIGAQNAFVLRQGLIGRHVLAVCLTCAISDAILITVGVTSFGKIAQWLPFIEPAMRYGGAAFLFWYGTNSLISAIRSSDALATDMPAAGHGLAQTLATCLAITWLNPHVYLDTVVLLGTISTQFANGQNAFAAGAITGSFGFFLTLGYGASWLRPFFARPQAWRILEGGIALIMWAIAVKLVVGS